MATVRSNLPLRLRQLLSGESSVGPSLKLESEPPPKIKAFIDRVIKSPLHDIGIPLSGFRWEYSKGNFHHWRPLFLHFDTYFETYLSCRKELLLSDDMTDENGSFPKNTVMQILRVMQIILDNCPNKSSFSGLEHFKLLLASTDPDIVIAALETLSSLVRINPSKLHVSGKVIGCGSFNSCLLSLAQGWGSKEEGLGLFSCVMANEKSLEEGFCLFPSDANNGFDKSQFQLGSSLHFEFHVAPQDSRPSDDKTLSSNLHFIHIPDLNLQEDDDISLLKKCVEQYGVPLEHRFSLLTRIRYARAFCSPNGRLYGKICLLAFIVLVQSGDAHDELASFFANEPEYTNELMDLVRSENSVPGTIRTLAMLALAAQLAAYSSSHDRDRILSGSSVIAAGGNRMVLLSVLQRAVLSLNNRDPSSYSFVSAILHFYLLHVISSSSSGSTIRGSGMVPTLLPLLQDSESCHSDLICSAVKTLQKLMDYSNAAVSLFKDLGGVELLARRLDIEVHRVVGMVAENDSSMVIGDASESDDDNLYSQKRLIKALLKALGSATYAPTNSTRSQNSLDSSLPASLSLIFQNLKRFGGDIYFSAVTLMSEIVHKDPTCFPFLHDLGLPSAFLSSVAAGILPFSKALTCVPNGLGAICLNTKGLEAVKEMDSLKFLVEIFTTRKYIMAMNEGVVSLANAVEELLRHVSSLRSVGVDIIIEIIEKLSSMGDDLCVEPFGKVEGSTVMETDLDDIEGKGLDPSVISEGSTSTRISDERFVRLCIFHVMVLVHRVLENSEACRLFVEKKGIEALMKLLLRPGIAQSSEGMSIALHSTGVFKVFAQYHSAVLAQAFCSSFRVYLKKALSGFASSSESLLLVPSNMPDNKIFSPLFVIEFILILPASKDSRWMNALLTEFGNGSRDVLEDIGQVHREVLWQISLLDGLKNEVGDERSGSGSGSIGEPHNSDVGANETEGQRFNSFRQLLDPLLRRRVSGWSVESQFYDLINLYRELGRSSGAQQRLSVDGTLNQHTGPSDQVSRSSPSDAVSSAEGEKQNSYYSSCCDMMRALCFHITHLCLELGKAMLNPSRRQVSAASLSSAGKSVASKIGSIVLDHLNFRGHVDPSNSDASISTKCRFLGKVVDFVDSILLERPESCNPVLVNCFYVCGVVDSILTTFDATSQLLSAVNRPPASPMEMDDWNPRPVEDNETDHSWLYGALSSYGKLMDHLVTSSFILLPSTKHLLMQPVATGNVQLPRDAETFVKVLQSKVLKAVLPVWTHPHFVDCSYEFIAPVIAILRHVFAGIQIQDANNIGARITGPPPDESVISMIVEMGFSRSRAEEALQQVGTNSVEMAMEWLFSHQEEAQEDDELSRALAMSLGSSVTSVKEDAAVTENNSIEILEAAQLPPVDELISACTKLLQMKESLAFPVRDLLVLISSHNNGEHRQKIITHFIGHLKASGSMPNGNSDTVLFAIFHVLALIFHEDSVSREIATKNGLAKIVLDLFSQWDQGVCNGENNQVPKWVTSSFLAIDCMLQVDSKLNPETLAAELSRKDSKRCQVAAVVDEDKTNNLQYCLRFSHHIDADEQKKLIEIACRCICDQLPSETMHGVLQLCATLTKNYFNALSFLDMGGLNALFCLLTTSLFPGYDSITAMIVRHILEDPQTLQQAMETEIRHSVLDATNRHSTGRLTPRSFLQNLALVISRDPLIFMQAAKSVCQVEMVGERPQVVLLKDREKEKLKEKEKDKLQTGDDKTGSGDVCNGKVHDSNTKNVKVHRKLPHSFTSTIDLLLDYVISFVPSQNVGLVDGVVDTSSMVDMEIDGAASKGKGKAIAAASQETKSDNQEPSAALAKAVFILKLLTKILLTYASSIHVLLRRDAEVGSGRARPQRGPLGKCNVGVFHHVLHEFVPYSERYKKDKKADGDWRQKLVNRASQFLVASSIRSSEARKRVFTEISIVFNNFVDSSDVSRSPNFRIHAYVELLNDIFAARSPTGSSISSEAAATFIDVGLVQSLTGMLKVLDLDHVDSPKIVTGIVKVLESVSKEHLHSADTNAGRASGKSPFEPNQSGRADNSSNRFQPLEAASQPDHNEGGSGHIVPSSATRSSGSSDSGTDDMEQDGNLDDPFATGAEDDYMHELSGEVVGAENAIATVEIRFDIPRDGQHNLVEDNDDDDGGDEEEDDMSGDEVDEDDDQDEDEEEDDGDDDEENNDLEEDEVHDMSHPDMDEDDHEVDEDVFNEDGFDEEDDGDEDDDEGVILQLEEGINGINVLDQIEVFSRDYNFVNDTFRVMPVDVFGSRRQGRTTSIYNLIGRNGDRGSPLQHPLLAEPSSLGTLMPRQSGDPGFLDMNSENNSSRLDSIFHSLRSGRHGHRFNMWVDENHQRSGSNVPTIPAGMEELLVSQLRQPTLDQSSEQNVASMQTQDKGEDGQVQGSEADSREEAQVENNANNGSEAIPSPNLPVVAATGNADIRPEDDQEGRDGSNTDMQPINLPYESNDVAVRDMEAVSQASSGSGATLGESLRSLEVEIGSADGHDDGGERQGSNERPSGDLHASRTRRGSAAHFSRDTSLHSVSEVMPHPPQESQSAPQEEERNSQAVNSGPIDPAFLDALPEELRVEVLSTQQNQVVQLPNEQPQSAGDIDPEFLAALPPDIREEVLAQQRVQRINLSQELEGQPVEMDTVSIIATFPSELREEVLLTSPDAILANLTPALVAEANMLRERYAHRYQNSTLLSMYPRYRRGESSRRTDAVGLSFDRAVGNGGSRISLGGKVIEADGAPLVDNDALKAMIRLFRVVQPLYKGQFQRLLLNLCAHCETRTTLMHILMDMLMLDVVGPKKNLSAEESFHRLYACKSYVMYSRPQFSNGVPPLVSRRILETMTYLARNHPNVAKLLLRLELPRLYLHESSKPDQGHGKSVMVFNGEEAEGQHQDGEYSIVLLFSLLNQPLYLRSIAHLEQLLNLLEVIINAEGVPRVTNNTDAIHAGEPSGSDGATQDANVNSDTTESAMSDVKSSGTVNGAGPSTAGASKECDVLSILLRLPKPELRLLCSLLAREGLSESVYSLVAEIMKKLVAIAPAHRHLFISELAASVENLTKSALNELCGYMEMDKELSASSTNGTAILRVLQALSSLVVSLLEKDKDLQVLQEKEYNDTLSEVSDINAHLEPLWLELSVCISKIETCSDSAPGLSSSSGSLAYSSTGSVAPLSAGSQIILPYVESFFVTCEKLRPWQSNAANDFITTEVEEATTSTGVRKPPSSGHAKTDDKYIPFVKFSDKHRKLLNSFIRQNPGLLEKSLSLMLKVPRFIDFDNKRAYFRSKIKHEHDHHHNPLRISVRRAYILEDSYNQLRLRSTRDLKGRLTVHFQGEEGIDAGGLTREWYQLLSRVIFDKGALLFTTVGNESTFQPNPNSVYQTEHLSYFKFVGRVVGKALFDGQLLDVHFTRSFYKHILGVKVTYHDIEAIDPDYFKNLKWLLENDMSDIIDLTFSIDADEEKLILYERTEVTDHELKTGGRNIRVTEENKHEYVDLVAEHRLTTAIRPQIIAFMEGFDELISRDLISIFNDRELELLISGLPEIDLDDLRANSEYSGYSSASPVIQWFWEVVQGFSKEDKARLLQFVTGTSKVPLEGFSALQGISGPQKFQIHKAYGSPDHLPSAHTCFNQLDLPEYPSKEQLQERLLLAIHEGNEGFGFG